MNTGGQEGVILKETEALRGVSGRIKKTPARYLSVDAESLRFTYGKKGKRNLRPHTDGRHSL
jgi:hypothetical protein